MKLTGTCLIFAVAGGAVVGLSGCSSRNASHTSPTVLPLDPPAERRVRMQQTAVNSDASEAQLGERWFSESAVMLFESELPLASFKLAEDGSLRGFTVIGVDPYFSGPGTFEFAYVLFSPNGTISHAVRADESHSCRLVVEVDPSSNTTRFESRGTAAVTSEVSSVRIRDVGGDRAVFGDCGPSGTP